MNQKSRYVPVKKKISVLYTLRNKTEPRNRSGINRLRVDSASQCLFSGGRDSIIRLWDLTKYYDNGEPVYVWGFVETVIVYFYYERQVHALLILSKERLP